MPPDYTPPPSPYPGRRAPLPTKVEQELRLACLAVLTNQRPSHIPDHPEDVSKTSVKAQLDYAAIKKSIDLRPADATTQASNRRSTHTTASDDLPPAADTSKFAYKPDLPVADLFSVCTTTTTVTATATANASAFPIRASSLRRADQLFATDPSHRRTKSGGPQSHFNKPPASLPAQNDRPKVSQRSASHETSGSTPQTDVTEYPWNTSTAPTSAGITPARTSKRTSTHMPADQDMNFKSDSNPMDWIRNELQKHQNKKSRRPSDADKPDVRSNTRAPSRARSIKSVRSVRSVRSLASSVKDGIIDYVRPGSRSRDQSRATSRSRANNASFSDYDRNERGTATRPPPRRDWRNWGRSNKEDGGSSADVSRSNSTRGRSENRKAPAGKPDLNRELPPLPSLNQWKEPERAKPAHIVNMRSPTTRSVAAKSSAVSEKDEIVAARLGSPARPKPDVYIPSRPRKSTVNAVSYSKSSPTHYTGVARTTDTDREVRDGGVRIEFTIEDLMGSNFTTPAHSHTHSISKSFHSQPDTVSNLRAPQSSQHSRSGSSLSRSLSLRQARSHTPSESSKASSNLGSSAPSFSKHRKYESSDIPPALTTNVANQGRKVASKKQQEVYEPRYRHVAEVRASPPPANHAKDDKKGWWHLKAKAKKQMTWMEQLEKLGVKDGVLLNDERASSPVVRY